MDLFKFFKNTIFNISDHQEILEPVTTDFKNISIDENDFYDPSDELFEEVQEENEIDFNSPEQTNDFSEEKSVPQILLELDVDFIDIEFKNLTPEEKQNFTFK